MTKPHVAMIRTKETITGTLYIDGQVVVGKCLLTMPVFEVEAATCNTKHKREQALIDFALEQNPDLVLARAGKLYEQADEDSSNDQ